MKPSRIVDRGVSRRGLEALIANLESIVRAAEWQGNRTEWADYEHDHGYSENGFAAKRLLVAGFLDRIRPGTVWDLGANIGIFSRVAADAGAWVLSVDGDPGAVDVNYLRLRSAGDNRLLPLWIDLSNPSPAAGWAHAERLSLAQRGPADAVLALALVHHLAITHNVPFRDMAAWMASLGRALIVEYVPKTDPQARRLLVARKDVFDDYTRESFEAAFGMHYAIESRSKVADMDRTIYLMRRRDEGAAVSSLTRGDIEAASG